MDTNEKITRRQALKRMGATAVAAAVAVSGVSALTSCAGRRRKRVILYFTATGNCLHIAREIADDDTELLSIPQLIKRDEYEIDADEIGIVYPIYGHMPPRMVRQFIAHARLRAEYRFAVLTYGCRKCNAVEIWDDISRRTGNVFDYIATIVMVDNWLPNFDMTEEMKIDKHIPENLQRIAADIAARRHWHEPVTEEERRMHEGFVAYAGLNPDEGFLMRSEKYFTVTDACIGCGACTDVCPRGNYRLSAHGVETQGECDFCLACIHNCPQRAILFAENREDPLLGRGEVNPNARYRNENISLMDIRRSNRCF